MKIWPRRTRPERAERAGDEDDPQLNRLLDDLTRLYRPKGVPEDMTTQFEEGRLPDSWAARRRAGIGFRKSLWGKSRVAVAVGLIIVLGITAAVARFTLPGAGESGRVAEALQFLRAIPPVPPVQEGEAIHEKAEVYFRYGPRSEEIGLKSGVPTESRIVEGWREVGPNSSVVRSYAKTTDANGVLVQEDVFRPGEWRSTDPRTGRVLFELPYQPLPVEGAKKRADQVQKELSAGKARVVSQSDDELVVESTEPVPPELRALPQEKLDNPAVPYVWDLDPRATITRITFSRDGVVTATEQYVVSGAGEEILITSSRTLTFEILDEMPAGIP